MDTTTKLLSFNEALSVAINQQMFIQNVTRADLGAALNTSGPTISSRLRGRLKWGAEDVLLVANFLGVPLEDLMPRREQRITPMGTPSRVIFQHFSRCQGATCGNQTRDLFITSQIALLLSIAPSSSF